jgi:large subunit ribosomal protein L22
MESTSYIKNVKSTPKKLRFLLPNIKKLSPIKALEVLRYTTKKSAKDLGKALLSAVSNAKNTLKVTEDMLQFKTVAIEEGQKLKRFKAGSKGSPKPIIRRYAHIKIVLGVKSAPVEAVKAIESKPVADKKIESKKIVTKKSK